MLATIRVLENLPGKTPYHHDSKEPVGEWVGRPECLLQVQPGLLESLQEGNPSAPVDRTSSKQRNGGFQADPLFGDRAGKVVCNFPGVGESYRKRLELR